MPTKRQNIKLGIFIATVALLLIATITFVGGQRFWRERDVYWVASRETVAGIGPQSPVTLHGVRVGEVASVELDAADLGLVWVELSIDPQVAIPAGVKAYFRATGLTGERAIDLADGERGQERLVPGSVIPRGDTTLEMLDERARVIAENATELTEQATDLIVSINRIVEQVEPERVGRLFDDAEAVMGSVADSSEVLEAFLRESRDDIDEAVDKVVEDVDTVSDKTADVLERAEQATAELNRVLDRADNVMRSNTDDVRATVRNLRRASRAAEQLIRQLRRRPSLLLRSNPPEERELP